MTNHNKVKKKKKPVVMRRTLNTYVQAIHALCTGM